MHTALNTAKEVPVPIQSSHFNQVRPAIGQKTFK